MDNYREEIVVKRNRAVNTILHALLCVIMAISALMAAMSLASLQMADNLIIAIIWTAVYGGVAFLIWWKKDILRLEYEYTFTNGELDFACVFGNKKRKPLGSMRVKNVEACGMVASGSFQRYLKMPGVKRLNWFLNRDSDLLFFYFQKDGKKSLIVCEPSPEMVELIKQYLPRGVFQIN